MIPTEHREKEMDKGPGRRKSQGGLPPLESRWSGAWLGSSGGKTVDMVSVRYVKGRRGTGRQGESESEIPASSGLG